MNVGVYMVLNIVVAAIKQPTSISLVGRKL